ncbi:hypothetical protein ABZ876_25530 [Streptomyces sp. NPDC046931]|uniref:hypothetical protein n=1 Tax=Streptomyces sp. NPDC046931 TaxID=3154806 RepID=UPI0033DFD66D
MRKQAAAVVSTAHEALGAAGEVKAGEREGTRSVSSALVATGRLPPPGPRPVPDMSEYGRLPRPATQHHVGEGHEGHKRMSPVRTAPADMDTEGGFAYAENDYRSTGRS